MQSRRKFIYLTTLSALGFNSVAEFKIPLYFMTEDNLKKRAKKIHSQILTLDSHCDTPLNIVYKNIDLSKRHDPYITGTKIDYPRMKEGGLDASFFAVFVGQGERYPLAKQKAKEEALKIFSAIHKSILANPNMVEVALKYEDAKRIEKTGKRAIFIGMENGYPIGDDLKNIEEFYSLGARYITLCHSSNNDICDSSTDDKGAEHNGVSAFGEKVIREMNRLGIMVDVSHVSDKSFYDAIQISKTPVIASHSSARAICNHPRNLDDEMLKNLANNRGVIQLCIYNRYIKEQEESPERKAAVKALKERYNNFVNLSTEEKKNLSNEWTKLQQDFPEIQATISDALDHIDHIVNLIGIDYVGIGTDFDGGGGIKGFFDISQAENLTYELVKRGYSKKDIEKIWGGNFLRVFKEVQEYAKK